MRTALTAIPMAPERGGAALPQGAEDASMLGREPPPMRLEETIAVSAHDIGHLEGWPHHCFRLSRDL